MKFEDLFRDLYTIHQHYRDAGAALLLVGFTLGVLLGWWLF